MSPHRHPYISYEKSVFLFKIPENLNYVGICGVSRNISAVQLFGYQATYPCIQAGILLNLTQSLHSDSMKPCKMLSKYFRGFAVISHSFGCFLLLDSLRKAVTFNPLCFEHTLIHCKSFLAKRFLICRKYFDDFHQVKKSRL